MVVCFSGFCWGVVYRRGFRRGLYRNRGLSFAAFSNRILETGSYTEIWIRILDTLLLDPLEVEEILSRLFVLDSLAEEFVEDRFIQVGGDVPDEPPLLAQ